MNELNINILDTIGNTPIVKLNNLQAPNKANLFAKLELFNPSGSIKDRMANYVIEDAEKNGLLKPGGTIIENSSGNTGSALAMIATVKGYKCIITMPDKMSNEKQDLMRAYGAKVVITPTNVPADSPESYYSVAKRLSAETENSYYLDQYNNQKNIEAHYHTTGPEIWRQTKGKIDVLVAGIGTGGTISGTGKFLKEKNPDIKIIAVDPIGSIFYDYFKSDKLITPKTYQVEGIGEDYLVESVDFDIIDDIIQVNDKDSFIMTRKLIKNEGIWAGGSSGSAMWAALSYAQTLSKETNIVTIFPDSGNRYLTKIFSDQWMKKQGYL